MANRKKIILAEKPYMPLYKNWMVALEKRVQPENRFLAIQTIFRFYYDDELPPDDTPNEVLFFFDMARASLEKSQENYENGSKGGRTPKEKKPAPGRLSGDDMSDDELMELQRELEKRPDYKR